MMLFSWVIQASPCECWGQRRRAGALVEEEDGWGGGGGGWVYNFVKHSFVHTQIPPCVRVHLSARRGTICACDLCFLRGGIIQKSLAGFLSNFVEKFQPWPQVWPRDFFSFLLEHKKEHIVKILLQLCLSNGCCHSITPSLIHEADTSWAPSVSCFMALTHT